MICWWRIRDVLVRFMTSQMAIVVRQARLIFSPQHWPQWWIHTVGSICHFLFLNKCRRLIGRHSAEVFRGMGRRGRGVRQKSRHSKPQFTLLGHDGAVAQQSGPCDHDSGDIACGKIKGTEQPRQTK